MNNQIQIFNNPQFGDVRVKEVNGEPMFCLADVCRALNLDARHVRERLSEGVVTTDTLLTAGGMQQVNFVNEEGFYDVILDSRKEEAKVFRKWATSEVFPSIRKHGMYATPDTVEKMLSDPDTTIKLLEAIKEERSEKERLRLQNEKQQKLIETQRQKVEFVDRILDTDQKIDIGQAAKILGLPFGRNTLFVKLREKGIFFQNRNEPKQYYIDRGYFELKEKWIDRNNHDGFMVVKVLVNQKGLSFLSGLFQIVQPSKQLAKIC